DGRQYCRVRNERHGRVAEERSASNLDAADTDAQFQLDQMCTALVVVKAQQPPIATTRRAERVDRAEADASVDLHSGVLGHVDRQLSDCNIDRRGSVGRVVEEFEVEVA